MFPLLAVLDGLQERGAFEPNTYPSYRRGPWWKRVRSRFGIILIRAWHKRLSENTRRIYPDRPGWNDYYMCLWCMTGNPAHALELYRRAVELPGPGATEIDYYRASSAKWMVASMRSRHPDFDLKMVELEQLYGVPLRSFPAPSPHMVA